MDGADLKALTNDELSKRYKVLNSIGDHQDPSNVMKRAHTLLEVEAEIDRRVQGGEWDVGL